MPLARGPRFPQKREGDQLFCIHCLSWVSHSVQTIDGWDEMGILVFSATLCALGEFPLWLNWQRDLGCRGQTPRKKQAPRRPELNLDGPEGGATNPLIHGRWLTNLVVTFSSGREATHWLPAGRPRSCWSNSLALMLPGQMAVWLAAVWGGHRKQGFF